MPVKKQIYAISLLLSFLIVLSHQVIPHHHHDTLAYDFTSNLEKDDAQKHARNVKHHHHDSHEEDNGQKDSDKDHDHPFPPHQHISATNEFDCTRTGIQQANTSNHSIETITVLCLFLRDYSEPPNVTTYSFGESPFVINTLFEPGAIALRGPPSIV